MWRNVSECLILVHRCRRCHCIRTGLRDTVPRWEYVYFRLYCLVSTQWCCALWCSYRFRSSIGPPRTTFWLFRVAVMILLLNEVRWGFVRSLWDFYNRRFHSHLYDAVCSASCGSLLYAKRPPRRFSKRQHSGPLVKSRIVFSRGIWGICAAWMLACPCYRWGSVIGRDIGDRKSHPP